MDSPVSPSDEINMSLSISSNNNINSQLPDLDDQRRRLGIASLHGKIKASITLLSYANKVCDEAIVSYEDIEKTETHLVSCIEGIFTALSETIDNSKQGIILCQKIIGDKSVAPLERFTNAMKMENGIN